MSICKVFWVGSHALLDNYIPRCYTPAFCEKLLQLYEGRVTAQPSLRNRVEVDPQETDRSLFMKMDLGDPWLDSGLRRAWNYIYRNKYLRIPPSWEEAIEQFDTELNQRVFQLQSIGSQCFDCAVSLLFRAKLSFAFLTLLLVLRLQSLLLKGTL